MAITYSDPDVDADEHIVQIAALTPTDNAVIIGNGTAWTAESGSTLRASLGLAIGSDVMAYDSDLADWAGVNPSSYLTAAAAASTYLTTSAAALAYQPLDSDLTAWAGVNPSSYSTTAQIAAAYQPLDADLTSWAGVTRASGFDTFVATPSSVNLKALVSDETGSGALVFATSPTLVTPALGTPASGVLTNCTGLPNASVVGLGTAALVNTGTSGNAVPLLNGTNLWGAARNQFAANSEVFALGVRYATGAGSFWFGASNSATPDGIFNNSSGTEILRLANGGLATFAGSITVNGDATFGRVLIGGPAGSAAALGTNTGSGSGVYALECQVDGTAYFQVRNNGTTYTQGGTVSTVSKRETKRDIEPSPYAFEDILGLQLRRFEYRSPLLSGVKKLGLIVDEVEDILPEAIARDADGVPDGLTYTDIALTVAITTMHKLNEALSTIAALTARLAALEAAQ